MNKFQIFQLESQEECENRAIREAAIKLVKIEEEYHNAITAANAEYSEQYADAYADYEDQVKVCTDNFSACVVDTTSPAGFDECLKNLKICEQLEKQKFEIIIDPYIKEKDEKIKAAKAKKLKDTDALKQELDANLGRCRIKPTTRRGKFEEYRLLRVYPQSDLPLNE